jgi:hypothetical protein
VPNSLQTHQEYESSSRVIKGYKDKMKGVEESIQVTHHHRLSFKKLN